MRFASLLVIVGFSACVSTLTETTEPETKSTIEIKDIKTTPEEEPEENPYRILMRCEFGCPNMMPYINIMPVVIGPDTTDTSDAEADADAGVTSPDACGDTYNFAICCGNDACEDSESPFFCPGDCM